MAKSKRMFNSNLVNASSFKMKISNKAKLLYFYIMLNADDRGFCDNADEIMVLLDSNDMQFHNEASLDLIEHGYKTAIEELVEKHMLLVFENKYGDKVYLVRQWYLHNQIPKDRITETTYTKYLEQVEINSENEYDLKQSDSNNTTPKKVVKIPTEVVPEPEEEPEVSEDVDEEDEESSDDYLHKDEDVEDFDYSVIPDKWDFDACSRAVRIHVKEINGEPITPEEKAYWEAYQKTTVHTDNDGLKKSLDTDDADDDLPF